MIFWIMFLLVAEAVKLTIELKNPLQISVAVSGISLLCQHSTNLDDLTSGIVFSFARFKAGFFRNWNVVELHDWLMDCITNAEVSALTVDAGEDKAKEEPSVSMYFPP